jgi:hypothetical protein
MACIVPARRLETTPTAPGSREFSDDEPIARRPHRTRAATRKPLAFAAIA